MSPKNQITMKLEGVIKEIFDTIQVSETFSKRELVLETNENYPQVHKIEFTQNKTYLLDAFKVGETVEVQINLRGREWEKEGKKYYFTSVQGWKIDLLSINQPQQQTYTPPPIIDDNTGGGDDLPF